MAAKVYVRVRTRTCTYLDTTKKKGGESVDSREVEKGYRNLIKMLKIVPVGL